MSFAAGLGITACLLGIYGTLQWFNLRENPTREQVERYYKNRYLQGNIGELEFEQSIEQLEVANER